MAGPLLIAACLLAEAAVLRVGLDDLDEGYFAQQAVRVLHGQLPYRDFESLYTPGLLYAHAALFAALGGPYLLAARGLALVARALTAVVLYALAAPLTRRPLLAAAPALVLLVGLDDAPVRWEPHPGWLSTLFALLTAACIARSPGRRWLIGGGLAAAASYAFKQNTGVFMLGAIAVHAIFRGRLGRPAPARLPRAVWPLPVSAAMVEALGCPLLGFVALTAAWLIPLVLALHGQLGLLAGFVGASNQNGLWSPPELPLLLPLACLAAGAWRLRRAPDARLTWYLIAGSGLFLTEYPRMDALHLAWSAPLLLVVGVAAVDRLAPPGLAGAGLGALLLVLPTISSRLDYLHQATTPLAGVRFADGLLLPPETADDLERTVAAIQQRTLPGEPVFVYPSSPLLYVLADRPNPTRFDHLNPGAADAQHIQQVIADLSASQVKLIVISDFWVGVWGPPGPNAPLLAWIDAHTRPAGDAGGRSGAYRLLSTSL